MGCFDGISEGQSSYDRQPSRPSLAAELLSNIGVANDMYSRASQTNIKDLGFADLQIVDTQSASRNYDTSYLPPITRTDEGMWKNDKPQDPAARSAGYDNAANPSNQDYENLPRYNQRSADQAPSQSADRNERSEGGSEYTAKKGDTYWQIAQSLVAADSGHALNKNNPQDMQQVAAMVDKLVVLNGKDMVNGRVDLQIGEKVKLPGDVESQANAEKYPVNHAQRNGNAVDQVDEMVAVSKARQSTDGDQVDEMMAVSKARKSNDGDQVDEMMAVSKARRSNDGDQVDEMMAVSKARKSADGDQVDEMMAVSKARRDADGDQVDEMMAVSKARRDAEDGNKTTITREDHFTKTEVTDSKGNITASSVEFDDGRREFETRDADGTRHVSDFDKEGRLTGDSVISPDGNHSVNREYDKETGAVESISEAFRRQTEHGEAVKYVDYTGNHQLLQIEHMTPTANGYTRVIESYNRDGSMSFRKSMDEGGKSGTWEAYADGKVVSQGIIDQYGNQQKVEAN